MEFFTIWEVFERSRSFYPDREAAVFVNAEGVPHITTHNRLAVDAELTARTLKSYCVEQGQRVCINLQNSPDFARAYLASSLVGVTSVLTGMTPEDRLICFLPLTH